MVNGSARFLARWAGSASLGKYLVQNAAELLRVGHESAVVTGELGHGCPQLSGECCRGPAGELPGGGGPGGRHDTRLNSVNDRMRAVDGERLGIYTGAAGTLLSAAEVPPAGRERLARIDTQLPMLLRRHRLLHNAVLLIFSSMPGWPCWCSA